MSTSLFMEQVVKLANAWASALTAVEKGTRDHEANQTLVFFYPLPMKLMAKCASSSSARAPLRAMNGG
jgi:hypothetical protein